MNDMLSVDESVWQVPRREFFKRLSAAASVPLAVSLGARGLGASPANPAAAKSSLPANESLWDLVKGQFILREGLILMNAANLCPSPVPVMETVFEYIRDEDRDASLQNRGKHTELKESSRKKLAQLMGASPDEIALVRNTSEANNTAVSSMNLGAGDEVLLWDQNHPTNNVAWKVRATRHGFAVKYVSLDSPPGSVGQIIETFKKGFTPRTKVLAFSHVSNSTGTALPAKELCALAHERGAIAHIDGAQTFGAANVNLHDLGCDSYSGSAHKWFMGPKEAGIFYVKADRVKDYWALIVGSGWGAGVTCENPGARKFECMGQRNDATLAAVGKAADFHMLIGEARIEARIRELATALKRGIAEIPGARLYTPMKPELSLGVVQFDFGSGVDLAKVYTQLYEKYGVAGAGGGGPNGSIRLCPHIYNSMRDVEKVVAALHSLAKNG